MQESTDRSSVPRRGLLLIVLILTLGLAGCLNDFDEVRLNHIRIQGIDVSAPHVGSGTVTFLVDVTLSNRAAPSGDLTLEVKAHNTVTGLLVHTVDAPVGTMDRDQTRKVSVPIDLPKQDGYRITVIVLQDGERAAQASGQVNRVEALANTVVATDLRVHGLEFLVMNVTGDRVRIETQVYLTHEGEGLSAPLDLQVKAREVSTGLLAAEEWTEVSGVPSEATRIHTVTLVVPAAYNYLVDVVLWEGDFIVGTGQGKVQLLPTFTVPKDEEVVVERPVVEDFRHDHEAGRERSDAESETPGPAVAILLLALVGMTGWMRRRT